MARLGLVVLVAVSVLTLKTVKGQDRAVNSCKEIICEGGKACVTDGQEAPQCICPQDCSDAFVPVCTSYWIEFNNTCQMHKFACSHDVNIDIHHFGKCDENAAAGSDVKATKCEGLDHLLQFPERYVEWMYVARERANNPQFQLDDRIDSMNRNRQLELVKWEFNRRDLTIDGKLDEQEKALLMEELVYEDCSYGFLRSCDLNKKDGIDLEEWLKCLKLA